MTTFAAALRSAREARGWSQYRLADYLLVDESTVSRWESGSRTPTLPMLYRIADVLGCRVAELLPDACVGEEFR